MPRSRRPIADASVAVKSVTFPVATAICTIAAAANIRPVRPSGRVDAIVHISESRPNPSAAPGPGTRAPCSGPSRYAAIPPAHCPAVRCEGCRSPTPSASARRCRSSQRLGLRPIQRRGYGSFPEEQSRTRPRRAFRHREDGWPNAAGRWMSGEDAAAVPHHRQEGDGTMTAAMANPATQRQPA